MEIIDLSSHAIINFLYSFFLISDNFKSIVEKRQ